MFEGLKKKFSDLVGSIVNKEETKAEEEKKIEQKVEEIKEQPRPEPIITHKAEEAKKHVEEKAKPPEIITEKPKLSVISKIKSVVIGKVTVKESDVDELLEKFKLSLVEADVNYEVAERLVDDMKGKMVGQTVSSSELAHYINGIVSASLYDILNKGSGTDMVKLALSKKSSNQGPFKILFIGPNGAGKTTTIAKITKMMIDNGMTCVMSASDTFRAAAIEQTVHHAEKLNVKVIKGNYGSDPASIAFDAISYAKAHGADVVLIDSAGRQDTNKSLMEEMRKMVRVTSPDMKVFIGESVTGSAILNQVREFNDAIKLDGIILTKLDVDAKGGNTISILSSSPVPILYFGMGEKYTDLMPYKPDFIIKNIVPAS
ncbi:MAG: signal recognition particle-docking protein FtsY [Candidatus Micrarchaeota archaeon]|nr:signal recognition particle-docking protein FtsY [Candidatus Micrarchaeota archaeon]